jgi:hypothetical protein
MLEDSDASDVTSERLCGLRAGLKQVSELV